MCKVCNMKKLKIKSLEITIYTTPLFEYILKRKSPLWRNVNRHSNIYIYIYIYMQNINIVSHKTFLLSFG